MAFQFIPPFAPQANSNWQSMLSSLGLTTNLKLSLDAGDGASYTSGQKWLDRSGNGYDFFVGADGSATSTDPTFTGVPNAQSSSEYWAVDGGDYFTYDSANEPWMETLHKNDAVFSFAFWAYLVAPGLGAPGLFGTTGDVAAGTGVAFSYSGTNPSDFTLTARNAGATAFSFNSDNTVVQNAWNFVAMSVNETGNALAYCVNGTTGSSTATYSSPAAGSASRVLQIGARGNADEPLKNGSRIASLAMWQGTALTAAQMLSIYTATRAKFGV